MPKLLQEVRDLIRTLHYSFRTEETYANWIKQYILFHKNRLLAVRSRGKVQERRPRMGLAVWLSGSDPRSQLVGSSCVAFENLPNTG